MIMQHTNAAIIQPRNNLEREKNASVAKSKLSDVTCID